MAPSLAARGRARSADDRLRTVARRIVTRVIRDGRRRDQPVTLPPPGTPRRRCGNREAGRATARGARCGAFPPRRMGGASRSRPSVASPRRPSRDTSPRKPGGPRDAVISVLARVPPARRREPGDRCRDRSRSSCCWRSRRRPPSLDPTGTAAAAGPPTVFERFVLSACSPCVRESYPIATLPIAPLPLPGFPRSAAAAWPGPERSRSRCCAPTSRAGPTGSRWRSG